MIIYWVFYLWNDFSSRISSKLIFVFGSFNKYIWDFVGGKPIANQFKTKKEVPAKTELSEALSKDLYAHRFRFVGRTICYAFMQAAGLVNDHRIGCYRHQEVTSLYAS